MLGTKSRKKREFEDELDTMRQQVTRRSGGRCEARVPGVCQEWASNVHHRLPRGAGGGNELGNLLDVCGSGTTGCHGWIEHNRSDAYELGLLLRRGEVPSDRPYEPPRRLV